MRLPRPILERGHRVSHIRWGDGTVTKVGDYYIDVEFDLDHPVARVPLGGHIQKDYLGKNVRREHKALLTKLGAPNHTT